MIDGDILAQINGNVLALINENIQVPADKDALVPLNKNASVSANRDTLVLALEDKDIAISILENGDALALADWDILTLADQDASAITYQDAPIATTIADALIRVFYLILCLFAFAFFLLIHLISKLSRASFFLLSEKTTYLSSSINCLFFFLILLSISLTNWKSLFSKYLRLIIYILSLSKISSAIKVTSYLLKSFLSIFLSIVWLKRYNSIIIYSWFSIVSRLIIILFSFCNTL